MGLGSEAAQLIRGEQDKSTRRTRLPACKDIGPQDSAHHNLQ